MRSVGYSELFSLSREDVLGAMKDYPEAQEILQNLGRKRLMEAQRVARSVRQPTSPGHDSSDNSTGKRIVDKLKSDVKGLKNVLRKSRRNTRPEESLELQPLAPKAPMLRRQTKVDDTHEISGGNIEPPMSPIGAGLPLLSRLRILKEKQEREEKKNLMEAQNTVVESHPNPTPEAQSITNPNLPLLQRILLLKAKNDQEAATDKEAPAKEPLLPKNTNPVEIIEAERKPEVIQAPNTETSVKSPTASTESGNGSVGKKPWLMLKDASIKTRESQTGKSESPQTSPPVRRLQMKQSLLHIRQQTKMYASVDDLSPEYCGLPFVKKLKILNERQKLAELEKAVRSSSLDCTESTDIEFDSNLTRSHSEACAIEYARKLAKLNQVSFQGTYHMIYSIVELN